MRTDTYKINKNRTAMGYGQLVEGNTAIQVKMYQGALPCTEGTLAVLPGAQLEIWVEDPKTECQGRDILTKSYYKENGTGEAQRYEWRTTMTGMLDLDFTLEETRDILVWANVEGSPRDNPNPTCGSETGSLVLGAGLDGIFHGFSRDIIPASAGMGHLVLSTDFDVRVPAGAHKLEMQVGSNVLPKHTVTTGGCCGDGELILISRPPY